jgi:transposase InsO family protein
MGKKNWLFSWTELGAKHVGIVQSLLATCRLHDINPYDYFVTCCNASASTRRHWCISSRRESGKRCLPTIRYGRTCIAWATEVRSTPRDRLLSHLVRHHLSGRGSRLACDEPEHRSSLGWSVAIQQRQRAEGLVVHSDRRSQYASAQYHALLAQQCFVCSMSRRSNCWDNTAAERFFMNLKVGLAL